MIATIDIKLLINGIIHMYKKLFYCNLNVLLFIQSLYCVSPTIIEPGERHPLDSIGALKYLYTTLLPIEKMYLFHNGCIVSPYIKVLMEYAGVNAFKEIIRECPNKKDLRLYKKEGIFHVLFSTILNRSFMRNVW